MTTKKVYIETVGCQMNVLDSELVIGALRKSGYTLTDAPADADVLLFNTCSVREHAEEKTYSALGRVRQVKRENPGAAVSPLPHEGLDIAAIPSGCGTAAVPVLTA